MDQFSSKKADNDQGNQQKKGLSDDTKKKKQIIPSGLDNYEVIKRLHQTIGNQAVMQLFKGNSFQKTHESSEKEKSDPFQAKLDYIIRHITGKELPDNLQKGVENLSGIDMSDVQVHYNSTKPAQVGAKAYTQGTDIHIAPGQEKHLSHEAWHVVQQKQGRVSPTSQMAGQALNDSPTLEKEANMMGGKALKSVTEKNNDFVSKPQQLIFPTKTNQQIIQCCPKVTGEFIDETPAEGSILNAFITSSGIIQSPLFCIMACFSLIEPNTSYASGEYRQFIKGAFRRNNIVQDYWLKGGLLSVNEWKEDVVNNKKYGYRNGVAHAPSMYFTDRLFNNPDKKSGQYFRSYDEPSSSADDDEMDLHFEGRLIDTSDGGRIIACRHWQVYGKKK